MPSIAVEIATRFAHALDAEDYPAAEALLRDDCEYRLRGEVHRSPQAIIASYRGNGDSANTDFDEVEYESSITAQSPRVAIIDFVDRLRRGKSSLTFQCRQIVEVDDEGRIRRIEHLDLPGQREALAAFKRLPSADE